MEKRGTAKVTPSFYCTRKGTVRHSESMLREDRSQQQIFLIAGAGLKTVRLQG